jgi:hypothetical protein
VMITNCTGPSLATSKCVQCNDRYYIDNSIPYVSVSIYIPTFLCVPVLVSVYVCPSLSAFPLCPSRTV